MDGICSSSDDDTIEYDIEIVTSTSSSCDSLAFLPASDPPQSAQSPPKTPPPPSQPPAGQGSPLAVNLETKDEQGSQAESVALEVVGQAVAADRDKRQESRVDAVNEDATGEAASENQVAALVAGDEVEPEISPAGEEHKSDPYSTCNDSVEISAKGASPEEGVGSREPGDASKLSEDLSEREKNDAFVVSQLAGLVVADEQLADNCEAEGQTKPEETTNAALLEIDTHGNPIELEIDLTGEEALEEDKQDDNYFPTYQPQPVDFMQLTEPSIVKLLKLDGPIEQLMAAPALQAESARRIERTQVQLEVPALKKQEIVLETLDQPEVVLTESEPVEHRQHPLAALIESEDLEREFDEEPPFEQRQVSVKRNQNPRQEYQLEEEIGRGRFGTVYRCLEVAGGRKLAAKFVHMRRKEDREDVEREVAIMSRLQHKRLLQLYDAFDDGQYEMCLITELVEGGELFERIVDDDFELTEKKAAIFMRQICEGVHYMHSQQIVHLDMKPENILCISRSGNRIKLIDFGLARQLDPKDPLRVMFGTPDFAAPEVLAYDVVSLATDMWSVGVICYVLLSGLSPFMGDNDMETMANVTRATYDFEDASFEPISDLAKDFIRKLLVRDQDKRLKPSECLQHPWLQRGGVQLEASVRERRESIRLIDLEGFKPGELSPQSLSVGSTPPLPVSLDKRNLKKYVVRRKWHKTVHAIMALGRMGANLKLKQPLRPE